jgi:RHS repeat-associated protein
MGCLKLSYYEQSDALEERCFFQGEALGKNALEEKKRVRAYRYGFNGMEMDNEIKNNTGTSYDFGSRMYDPRLGRWMSTDPIIQSHESPYSFVANNPVIYIDVEGENNVIYLVALSSVKSELSKTDLQGIADVANAHYRDLGLETRVVVFESSDPFDPSHLDLNDSYVLMGTVSEITDKVAENSFDDEIRQAKDRLIADDETNPERSATTKNKFEKGILIASDRLGNFTAKSASNQTSAAAFLIVHGSVHNTGFNVHGAEPLQFDGGTVLGKLGEPGQMSDEGRFVAPDPKYNSLGDFIKASENKKTISKFGSSAGFGKTEARDNYYFNKRSQATNGAAQPRSNPQTVKETNKE